MAKKKLNAKKAKQLKKKMKSKSKAKRAKKPAATTEE